MPVQPTLDPLPPRTVHPGKTLTFFANVSNPDGIGLTFDIVPNPDPNFPGATINGVTGQFSWTVPGNQVLQALILTIRITDANQQTDTKQCAITVANQPPLLDALPPRSIHPGKTLAFAANAVDPDGDALTFETVPNPDPNFAGAVLNGQTGQFSWAVPANLPAQGMILTVKVSDPSGASDTKQCAITIANQPPVLDPLPPRTGHPGKNLSLTATAVDPDNDPLTFVMVPNPDPNFTGAILNAQTGQFSWPVPATFPPQALILTLKVSDPSGASDTKQCAITIANRPPVLDPLPPRTGHPGNTLTLIATATDPDNDPLSFAMVPNPDPTFPGAILNAQTGQFSWPVPVTFPPQALILNIKVSDPSGASDTKQCPITIVNQPPVLDPLPNRNGHPGGMVILIATAADPDLDVLTFEMVPNPNPSFPGAMLNPATGQFNWTVPPGFPPQALILTIKVSDPSGASDTKQCIITIT